MNLCYIRGSISDSQGRCFPARQNRFTSRISANIFQRTVPLPKSSAAKFSADNVGGYKSAVASSSITSGEGLLQGVTAKVQPISLCPVGELALKELIRAHATSEILRDFNHPDGGSSDHLLQQHIRDRVTEELEAAQFKAPESVSEYLQARATKMWVSLTESQPAQVGHSTPSLAQ
jgi:hypothetical protein